MDLRLGRCGRQVLVTLIVIHQVIVVSIWIQHDAIHYSEVASVIPDHPLPPSGSEIHLLQSDAHDGKTNVTTSHHGDAMPEGLKFKPRDHGNVSDVKGATPAPQFFQAKLINWEIKCNPRSGGRVACRERETGIIPAHVGKNFILAVQKSSAKFLAGLTRRQVWHCNRRIHVFNDTMIQFRDVIIDPRMASARAAGGENLEAVIGQTDDDEFYKIRPGFLRMHGCHGEITPRNLSVAGRAPHVQRLNLALLVTKEMNVSNEAAGPPSATPRASVWDSRVLLSMTRYEYANVFWEVLELYNAFLTLRAHNQTFKDADLMLLDAHPRGSLDDLHEGLFGRTLRPSQLKRQIRVETLFLNVARQFSPMLVSGAEPLPMVTDFQRAVLDGLGMVLPAAVGRRHRCANQTLSVLVIWRRDYVAHPRNPNGVIARKIANEEEFIQAARAALPSFHFRDVQLDNLTVRAQLRLLVDSDVMVGMHGAALAYSIFMPAGGALLEMWPYSKSKGATNWHMRRLATGSGHHYTDWRNSRPTLEVKATKSTYVTAAEVIAKLRTLSQSMCAALL